MIKVMLDSSFNLASPFIDLQYLHCEKYLLLTSENAFCVCPDINSSFPDNIWPHDLQSRHNIIVLAEPFIPLECLVSLFLKKPLCSS